MKLYLRCIYYNRATLVGLLLPIIAVFCSIFPSLTSDGKFILLVAQGGVGLILLVLTSFGAETARSYTKAKAKIAAEGVGDLDRVAARLVYCDRVGIQLAISDYIAESPNKLII